MIRPGTENIQRNRGIVVSIDVVEQQCRGSVAEVIGGASRRTEVGLWSDLTSDAQQLTSILQRCQKLAQICVRHSLSSLGD
jgi:hypothetical protein